MAAVPDFALNYDTPHIEILKIKDTPEIVTKINQDNFSVDKFFKLMKYERLRLITYLLYRHNWPKNDIISPAELAKAGFFYIREDEVQCAFCRGIVSGWSHGDVAMEEHKAHFKNCPFVLGEAVGNVSFENDPNINSEDINIYSPISSDVSEAQANADKLPYNMEEKPMFALFSSEENRKRTFMNPLWHSELDKDLLIEAGFFFTGKKDRTRCFQCGGLLFKWCHDDDPFEEHAKFFPRCHFINNAKGADYLEYVRFKSQIIDLRLKLDTPLSTKNKDLECMRNISYANFLQMKQSASRLFQKLEKQNENSSSASEAGFYQRYLKKYSFLIDCQKLFQYLLGMNIIKPSASSLPSSSSSSASSSPHSSISNLLFSLDESDNSSSDEFSMRAQDEADIEDNNNNRKSGRSMLTCAICYDNQICVVFLPCGHQLACQKCAEKMKNCPVCRSTIQTRQRTYFA